MQRPSGSSQSSNGTTHPNGSIYCSTSTLSDTGSWDTDFDDDQNSESSGFYGDVAPTMIEKSTTESQPKASGVGRVAALAKTVAASLAASGHAGPMKFQKSTKKNESLPEKINGNVTGHLTSQRTTQGRPVKSISKLASNQGLASNFFHGSSMSSSFSNDKGASHPKNQFTSNSSMKNSISTGLPKPPGPESEQVQQVIGALGHMWSSDSMSLSSQTQSDDDYEPVQSDSSPQMPRLSPHSAMNGNQPFAQDNHSSSPSHFTDKLSSISDTHSTSAVVSFLHSSSRTPNDHPVTSNSISTQLKGSQTTSPSTPFVHSSSAAAALAAVAASAAACRLSQCSKRSSGCDSVYSPSSGSSLSDASHHTVLQNVDCVYEPIEEKEKCHSQRSFLHSIQNLEKGNVKRPASNGKISQHDQRPPVPNRPLPPTPRPPAEKPANEPNKGLLVANLEHQPWFHNVDRKQAEELIKNGIDGYFLIRPSSQSQNPLTLTLWFNQRVYNISIRQRKDGRIALGFDKPDEQSFSSIEEMVMNYQSENLLLFSRNERTGRTVLTKSPPKHTH